MTDQDPTQAYQPPPAPEPAVPPAPEPAVQPAFAAPAPPVPPVYAAPAPPVYAAPAPPVPPAFAAAEPPGPAAVPTTPVEMAPAGPRPGRSKLKWLIAGVVTLLVAGTAAGATLLLTKDAGDPAVLAYAPADSVAYAEMRLDLPGSQSAELAKVMKAFPGFEDQAAFPVKLSEALDQLVGEASDGKQSYKNDIEPWFNGQVSGSIGPLPSSPDPKALRAVVLVGVKDAAKAQAWADALVKQDGATTTTATYNGVTITLVAPKGAVADLAGMKAAYAITGPVLALGDETSVKAVIDTGGKSGLPTNAQFKQAEASVTGDRLAFAYVDTAAIVKGAGTLAGAVATAMPQLPAIAQDMIPAWAASAVSAKDGAFVIDTRSPHLAKAGPPENSESKIPGLVPADTVALAEGHNVGDTITKLKDALAAQPELKDQVKQVEDALAIVGGWDAATGWIDEAGVAITKTGTGISGGLVVTPTDSAAAERLLNQLKAFIQLGGSQAGLTVKDEPYNGATITTIDLGGLGDMLGSQVGGVIPPGGLTISYAVTDKVVVLGYGTDFTKAVIDTAAGGPSLASTDRFKTSLTQAGASNSALLWVDVTGVRGLVEGMIPDLGDYGANVKPYLASFDSVIATSVPGDTIDAGTLIIRVKGG
jgi:hypothetical protein